MKARDFPALHDAVRDTAVMLWNRGTVEPGQFLMAFNAFHGQDIDTAEMRYGYEQYVVSLGLKKFKSIRSEAQKMAGSPQLDLPMELQDVKIVDGLAIARGWVPLWEADVADLDAYAKVLQDNANACIVSLTEFLQMVRLIKPVMEAHGLLAGQALSYIARQQRDAAE
jgi:hypothetical protein